MMKAISIFILLFFLVSCANEKKFVRFHDKENGTAAKHCGEWYPVTEKVTTKTEYKEGETVLVPGEVQYISVDCDSAVAANKTKGKPIYVAVPGKLRIDTIFRDRDHYVENTATVTYLKDSLAKVNRKYDRVTDRYADVKKTRNKLWGVLTILVVGTLVYWVIKLKTSILKIPR